MTLYNVIYNAGKYKGIRRTECDVVYNKNSFFWTFKNLRKYII